MLERYIDKLTGTYAETLEAIGVASTMRAVGFTGPRIEDQGTAFIVRAGGSATVGTPDLNVGFPYIWEKSKEPRPSGLGDCLDYEAEREKRDASRKVSKKGKAALSAVDSEGPEVHPDFTTAAMLASMRKGWNGDRDLAKWITANQEGAVSWVRFRLGLDSEYSGKLPSISNTQVLNPIAGKGVHAAKTEIRSAGSIPGQLVDPFSEWMKLRGLWLSMLLYRSDEDFKFFVIEPADIAVDEIGEIRRQLQAMPLWGGVGLDIRATLNCTRLLILRSDAVAGGAAAIKFRGRMPRKIISGLRQAYFKSLGTAAALMNDAFLPLPDWFAVSGTDDARAYLSIIDEAIGEEGKGGCLNSLQEKNSDDGEILQQYREWLLSGELEDLLDFHYRFAMHLMQRLSRREWAKPFGTDNLSLLLSKSYGEKYKVTEIIEDPGFQSIARALRNATIYALTIPNMKREVRFGVAQKWKQKMKGGGDEFATEVAEFVQGYNWETAHRLKGRGHSVTTEELNSLMGLLARKPELVGALLLAYGFSRAPKREDSLQEEMPTES